MKRITCIRNSQRRRLKKVVQRDKDKRLSRRVNAILLVHSGRNITEVAEILNTARSSVSNWCSRYMANGFGGLKDAKLGRPPVLPGDVICQLLFFLVSGTPQDLEFQRSRWSSKLLSHVISVDWHPNGAT